MEKISTADICDHYAEKVEILAPIFRNYGGFGSFHGKAVCVKVFEDNVLVKETLKQDGNQNVLVVDGGASMRCALLGDQLATMAQENGWAGIIIYGCIRDSLEISKIRIGVKALNTCPIKSIKYGEGRKDISLRFAGVQIHPGFFIYSDEDGILVSQEEIDLTFGLKK